MPEPDRHLHAIDPETGELPEGAPQTLGEALVMIQQLRDELEGSTYVERSLKGKMTSLRREVEETRAKLLATADPEHELFPRGVAHFRYWQERCNHPRMTFGTDEFEQVMPFLRRHEDALIRQAIRGAEFDAFETRRKNGTTKRHDGWDLIFRDEPHFWSFVERAPEPEPTARQRSMVETAGEIAVRVEERARLIDEDPIACAHLLLEVDRLILSWRNAPERRTDD